MPSTYRIISWISKLDCTKFTSENGHEDTTEQEQDSLLVTGLFHYTKVHVRDLFDCCPNRVFRWLEWGPVGRTDLNHLLTWPAALEITLAVTALASGSKIIFRQVSVGSNCSLEETREGRVQLKYNRKEIQVWEHVLKLLVLVIIIIASFYNHQPSSLRV